MSKDTTADRANLARVCALVRPALASQEYVKALVHIRFDGEFAMAHDGTMAIATRCELPVKCLVPGVMMIQALGSFGGKEFMFQQDGDELRLSSGRAKVKLPTLDLGAWPFELPEDRGTEVDLDDEILRGIEKCLISVGSNPSYPAQMGVTLECGEDGRAVLYSTDNRSISRYLTGSKVKLPADVPVIMPTAFCEQLVILHKAFPKEDCHIVVRDGAETGSLVANFGDEATLFSRVPRDLTPVPFPDIYRRFVAEKPALVDIPDTLDAALDRALLVLGSEGTKVTKLEATGRGIRLSSSSSLGDADDVCESPTKGLHDGVVQVNPVYLARAAKVTTLMGITPKVVAFGDEKGKFLHLVAHL